MVCVVMSINVYADSNDGNWLLGICSPTLIQIERGEFKFENELQALNVGTCLGYMLGITQTIVLHEQLSYLTFFCVPEPERVITAQAVRIVVRYLKDHPELLHRRAIVLAHTAFEEAFPCRTTPTK